jgi:serine-type D-Ala-D-Ala carboxypeptidase
MYTSRAAATKLLATRGALGDTAPSFTPSERFAINRKAPRRPCRLHPSPSHPGSLIPAFEDQGTRFSRALRLLQEGIQQRAFPAASVAVTLKDDLVALRAQGNFTFDPASSVPSPDTLFDLASLTKVMATTAMTMILYERGLLDLEMPVIAVVGEFAGEDPRRDEVTLRMLLAHSSGLPAYEKLYLRARTRDELLQAAFSTDLANDPGSHAEYSDIGFIILGVALERLADEPLARFCQREIFGPLGLLQTTFNPASEIRAGIPPTADDQTFRHRMIQGEVQDENASVLGGIAGHAGLFASAQDVARFAHAMLPGKSPLLRSNTLRLFTTREVSPPDTSRALGWDTPSAPSQSGKYFSPQSYGHLGYTGTSLWIDAERELSITLLTNRTWPDCSNQAIKEIRPQLHDAVIEALGLSGIPRE